MKNQEANFSRVVILLVAVALTALLFTGGWLFNSQEQLFRRQVEENLSAIATTKAKQIADWRQERMDDATLIMDRTALIADADAYLATSSPEPAAELLKRFTTLQHLDDYLAVSLITVEGEERLRQGDIICRSGEVINALATAIAERRPVFTELHHDERDVRLHMAVVVPLFSEAGNSGTTVGAMLLSIDLNHHLFPLIQSWPVASASAETLMVQREDEQVLFLNNLRHRPDTALKLRLPLSRTDVSAVKAVLGEEGIVYGIDYREVQVVSALAPIPDSDWFMIAEVDRAEAFAAWHFRAAMLVVLLLLSVAMLGVVLLVARQHTQKKRYQRLYQAESALRASIEKHAVTLQAIGDAVIATDAEGRVEIMNPVAERLTGWTWDEARGMAVADVFHIIHEETRQPLNDPVAHVLQHGEMVGLVRQTLLLARDGRETPIADSGSPIRVAGDEIIGVVLVFRDQTEERQMEYMVKARLALLEFASHHSLDELQLRLLATIAKMTRSPIAFCHLLELEQRTLFYQQDHTASSQGHCRAPGKNKHFSADKSGVWADCIREKKPVIHNDCTAFTHTGGMPAGHVQVERQLLVPVVKDGRVRAVLGMGNRPGDYTAKDIETVSYLADVVWEMAQRKRAVEMLQESDRMHRTLLSNLPGLAYRLRNDADWTIELASDGCTALTGYRPEDLVGNARIAYAELIHPEDRPKVRQSVLDALQNHRPYLLNYRIRTAAEQEKWVWEQGRGIYDPQGELLALEGFIIDITDRRRAETERERLLLAVEQIDEMIVITDAAGTIQYVNKAFEEMTGYHRNEVLGQNPRILKSGKQDVAYYQTLWQTIASGQTWQGQMVNRRKDGSSYIEEMTISPVWDAEGEICNYIAAKHDVTEQLRLSRQLQQAQKMDAVGRLAGGVAHDFNNMLMVISGYAEMALAKISPDDSLHADLLEIVSAARRSGEITRQLLGFARKQTISPRVLSLNDKVDEMLKMLRRLIGEDIDLVWKPAGRLWQVKIDPTQLNQILANLLINARDAIDNVGQVTIETENVTFDESYCADHAGFVPGRFVLLAVSDSGCGMDREILDKIFEPFFTTKEQGQGTGLGLATVFGIVKQNNGFVNVYSEPGKGTTFKIYLPCCLDEISAESETVPATRLAGGGEVILVVEDEAAILQLTKKILTNLNYRVLAVQSPAEALRLAEQHPDEIALMITDVVMPEMNGRELAERMKMLYPQLRCLFMSGYTANVIAHRGVLDKGVNFISKPFSAKDIAEKIKVVLESAIDRASSEGAE